MEQHSLSQLYAQGARVAKQLVRSGEAARGGHGCADDPAIISTQPNAARSWTQLAKSSRRLSAPGLAGARVRALPAGDPTRVTA